MFLTMFRSKIHRATVTEANLNYMGSITIDEALLEASGILPNEKVQVVNNNNGNRFETYVIRGPRNSGIVCLNGAAARLAQPGDVVIIIAYALLDYQEAQTFKPTVVMVDSKNRVTATKKTEAHGEISPPQP
jgi:aspartate 1-decarboxylase